MRPHANNTPVLSTSPQSPLLSKHVSSTKMGVPKHTKTTRSHTLPSSPTHSFSSSSSSDFEFTISLSPRKSSAANLCPADELFYKGQLLPLHLSPRISMVRTLLASSSTSSSSDATTSASRDSTASSNDSRSSFSTDLLLPRDSSSSRPSSVTDQDDEYKRLTTTIHPSHTSTTKKSKYFSFSRFSSVFQRKESKMNPNPDSELESGTTGTHSSSVKRMSTTAKEVIRKYFKKVKPLYEKLSSHNPSQINTHKKVTVTAGLCMKADGSVKDVENSSIIIGRKENVSETIIHSFSGNLRYPRRRSIVSSCPSSMRSSPSHSGTLSRNKNVGFNGFQDSSSMEELQSAIQGAIAHCKNSMMVDNKSMASNEV